MKRMVSIFREIASRFRYGLVIKSFLSLLGKCGVLVTPFYLHKEGKFGQDGHSLNHDFSEYHVEFLRLSDTKEIAELSNSKLRLRRLKEGKKCFVARYHGNLAAFSWYDLESCHSSFYKFKLDEGEAYLFDAYTLQPYRGKNLAYYLRFKLYQELEAIGRINLYSITEYFNKPAIRFKNKLNAKPLILGIHIKLFKKWSRSWKIKDYRHSNDAKIGG